jgi:hypothetical protein
MKTLMNLEICFFVTIIYLRSIFVSSKSISCLTQNASCCVIQITWFFPTFTRFFSKIENIDLIDMIFLSEALHSTTLFIWISDWFFHNFSDLLSNTSGILQICFVKSNSTSKHSPFNFTPGLASSIFHPRLFSKN